MGRVRAAGRGRSRLVTTLTVAELATHGLPVQIARGRSVAAGACASLSHSLASTADLDKEVAVCEAELATWQGDLDRARSAIQRAPACGDAIEHLDQPLEVAWVCMKGLTVEAERAERARVTGDAAAVTDAVAVGHTLLERARAAVERAPRLALHMTCMRGLACQGRGRVDSAPGPLRPEGLAGRGRGLLLRPRVRGGPLPVAAGRGAPRRGRPGAGDRCCPGRLPDRRAAWRRAAAGALEALARRGRLDLGAGMPAERALAGLTPREVEVLRLLVEGRSNRQIAEQLFISGKTASVHVTNLLAKLGVHSRLEAAATARRLGLDQPAQRKFYDLTACWAFLARRRSVAHRRPVFFSVGHRHTGPHGWGVHDPNVHRPG